MESKIKYSDITNEEASGWLSCVGGRGGSRKGMHCKAKGNITAGQGCERQVLSVMRMGEHYTALVTLCHFHTGLEPPEKRERSESLPPSDWPVYRSVGHFL